MTTSTLPSPNKITKWLDKPVFWRITPAHIFLIIIVLISAFLHFYNIESIGDANLYYTAAVESMLDSWENFFFVSAEPGGSVTVDKPPLGLWIEAGFALVLGVSGFAVVLPNILSGLISIPILYHLVKKYFGSEAGLVAALVLVFTPIALAADRNNTMDGMLTLVLLLTAWCFILAVEHGKLRWLLLGGLLIGLGFNIKMMQVLLPVPAFLGFYFLASKTGWLKKTLYIGLTVAVALVVSLSWAVVVDLVLEDSRPYIGSSKDNTVMELIFGHNGMNRLTGGDRQRNDGPPDDAIAYDGTQPGGSQLPNGRPPLQDGNLPQDGRPQPQDGRPPQGNQYPMPPRLPGDGPLPPRPIDGPPNQQLPPDGQFPAGQMPPDGADGPNQNQMSETGNAGLLRFFSLSLANELSWILPFALGSLALVLFMSKLRLPVVSNYHKGFMLWGGWLVTCLVFFSVAGFFHAYYLVMMAPALGAVVGMGWAAIQEPGHSRQRLANGLLIHFGLVTLFVQMYLVNLYGLNIGWVIVLTVAFIALGVAKLVLKNPNISKVLSWMMLLIILVVPAAWSFWTISPANPNVNLPSAYDGAFENEARPANELQDQRQRDLITYLEENTQDTDYLLAVPNASAGAGLIIETGRPVLYMGGFTGGDPVIDADDLQEMVAGGELKYVMYGGTSRRNQQEIMVWLRQSCTMVDAFSQTAQGPQNQNSPGNQSQGVILYQCAE